MFRFLKKLGFYSRFGRLYNREMSSSEIRAQKNQLPSLISSLPEEIFVDIVAPCLSILLPESLPSLHVFPITHGEEREKTLSDIAKACEEWGFFQLVSHGTPLELLNKVKDLGSDCYKYRERRSVQDFNTREAAQRTA